MKIDAIDVYLVRLPLKKPFRTANFLDTVYVRMTSDGLCGWSEVSPGNEPFLTEEWSGGVFQCLADCVLPRFQGEMSIGSAESLLERFAFLKGNQHAKAAIEMAWMDLDAKQKGKTLYEYIGGTKKDIPLGMTFDRCDSPQVFLDGISKAAQKGVSRITLKIRPGWDINALAAVRNLHPSLTIHCDIEGALSLSKHSDTLYRFGDFLPDLMEQPLDPSDFVGHAMLQEQLRTSISLDESIKSLYDAEMALDLQSARTFCLKPGRLGGLGETKAVHDLAASHNIPCYSGCELISSVGYRFVAAAASLQNCTLPVDFFESDEYFISDPGMRIPTELKIVYNHADCEMLTIPLWKEPGIGFEPNMDIISASTLKHCSIEK